MHLQNETASTVVTPDKLRTSQKGRKPHPNSSNPFSTPLTSSQMLGTGPRGHFCYFPQEEGDHTWEECR
jgi:hypothetical protein